MTRPNPRRNLLLDALTHAADGQPALSPELAAAVADRTIVIPPRRPWVAVMRGPDWDTNVESLQALAAALQEHTACVQLIALDENTDMDVLDDRELGTAGLIRAARVAEWAAGTGLDDSLREAFPGVTFPDTGTPDTRVR